MSDDRPDGTPEPAPPPENAATGSDNTPSAAADSAGAHEQPASGAAAPSPDPVPSAAADAPAEQPTIGEPATAEQQTAPAAYAPPPATPPPAGAAPPAATAAPPPDRRGGVFVPTWLAVLVAILLIGGIGFGIGFASADNGDSDSHRASSSQQVPSTERPRNNPGNNAPNPGNGAFPNGRDAAQTAFLGVSVESVDNNGGARITNVQSGSPAADAGLKTGDVITKIGDTNVQNAADIFRAVRTHSPGDSVTITYTRDGNSAQAKVQLGRLSDATRSSVPS